MNVINGTGQIVAEPDWSLILNDALERQAAGDHWRRVTTEMRERETLAPSNAHAIQRLVLTYIEFDRNARFVAENGAVMKPKRGNPRAIARLSPYFQAMREMGNDAASLEAELGISPRRRSGVGKVQRRVRQATGADAFIQRRSG